MRKSFLDEHAFPLVVISILIFMPLSATIFVACSQPSTPEEKIAFTEQYAEWTKEDLLTISPRTGVECYVLRGNRQTEPRTMSCVVIPKESN
jgi:hypothetical protein